MDHYLEVICRNFARAGVAEQHQGFTGLDPASAGLAMVEAEEAGRYWDAPTVRASRAGRGDIAKGEPVRTGGSANPS